VRETTPLYFHSKQINFPRSKLSKLCPLGIIFRLTTALPLGQNGKFIDLSEAQYAFNGCKTIMKIIVCQ